MGTTTALNFEDSPVEELCGSSLELGFAEGAMLWALPPVCTQRQGVNIKRLLQMRIIMILSEEDGIGDRVFMIVRWVRCAGGI